MGSAKLKPWLAAGLGLGFAAVIIGHDTDLIHKLTGRRLPVNQDPLHRVRGWSEVAGVAGEAREELLADGKPFQTCPIPVNQFYFWPGYQDRKGQNAIFIRELERDRTDDPPVPQELQWQFESVTPMGVRNVLYHGRVLRPLQIYACRGLR